MVTADEITTLILQKPALLNLRTQAQKQFREEIARPEGLEPSTDRSPRQDSDEVE